MTDLSLLLAGQSGVALPGAGRTLYDLTPGAIAPLASPVGNLPTWRTKLAATKAGTARTRVLVVGDSTAYGCGAGSSSNVADCRRRSFSAKLSDLLTNLYGVPSAVDSFAADGGSGGTITSPALATYMSVWDPRVVASANWVATGALGVGGKIPGNNTSGDTGAFAFTPDGLVDTFAITTIVQSGNATLNASVDGGAATAINTAGASAALQRTAIIAGTAGVHTLSLSKASGNTSAAFVAMVEAWNSTLPAVDIVNAGWSASKSGDWNSGAASPWLPLPGISFFAPDLTIFDLGINSWLKAQETAAALGTNMSSLISAAKASGDVLGIIPAPSGLGGTFGSCLAANQQACRAQLLSTYAANNCAVVDLWANFGSYGQADSRGMMYDQLHCNSSGYGRIAGLLAQTLMS